MKAAVIGTGRIARQHLECLKTIPDVTIAGVCDLWPALAECAAERHGIGRWFTDHRRMLDEIKPDVVHVTTPPTSHFRLSMDALEAGAHVIVEKPITVKREELEALQGRASEKGRALIEDYNYLFNSPVRQIQALIETGEFGEVTHVEALICLNILGQGSVFNDLNAPHPCLSMPGGAIADFLTHLASLSRLFAGAHRSVRTLWSKRQAASALPSDEFRALVDGERASVSLGFSAHTQPDVFWLRVYGSKMRAETNLFEPRLTIDRLRGGPKPLMPLWNGLNEMIDVGRGAVGGLWRKLSGGPGAYEGLWELLGQTYRSLKEQAALPINEQFVRDVNRLVGDLTRGEFQL
jgi:predicted dehydrogenase